jgi:hypothetical protein
MQIDVLSTMCLRRILVNNQSNHQSNIILGAKTAINQFNYRVLETAIKSIIKIVID